MKHFKKIYGLTGGIASGKSTVSEILKNKGIKVIDADKIAREIMEVGSSAYEDVIIEFGSDILNESEEIDRKKLSDIVFNDREKLERLNEISHKRIMEKMKMEIGESSEKLVFLDIPLLYEVEDKLGDEGIVFDGVIVVYVNSLTQIERLMKRDGISLTEAKKIIGSQMPIDEKRDRADHIINNELDLENLEIQVDQLLDYINA